MALSNYIPLGWNRKTALLVVLAASFLALYPCLGNGFTNWDDGTYLLDNPWVLSLESGNFVRIFSSLHQGLYKPLVFVTFALEHYFFGFNPFVYHAVNLAFHLANCALVFLLVERLSASWSAAFVTALLFGIHPMHVESVAWVSERKDMLYSFFFLLSAWLYLRYRDKGSAPAYWGAVAAYLLSLLSKPFGIALPALLFLFDWLQRRPVDKKFWTDKIPFMALGICFTGAAYFTVKLSGVLFSRQASLLEKAQLLSYSFLFYVAKAFWPSGLSVIYPYPLKNAHPASYTYGPLLLAAWFVAVAYLCRGRRLALFGMLFFMLTLMPGLQWLPAAPSLAMDHYSYIPYIGLFMAVAVPVLDWLKAAAPFWPRVAAVVFSAAVLALGFSARGRCAVWQDGCALWSDMLAKHQQPIAYVNRAACLIERGEHAAALPDLERAIELNADYHLAYSNRALVFAAFGDQGKALADMRRSVALAPKVGSLRFRLGMFLLERGQAEEA
ncbi:MAG TPA: hypothetical protein PLL10_04585, partial [Elusimicrobiales bacterium]|nr:hypothetical protein [Elusimicrobiales bacterium]